MKISGTLILFILLNSVNAENNCKFLIFQKTLYQVSEKVNIPLKIRFNLHKFDKFCILKVKTPINETLVTFNLTKREFGDKSDFFGDKLNDRMSINYNRKLLKIENSLKSNGYTQLSGRYEINEKSIFVLPYTNSKEIEQKVVSFKYCKGT